MAKLEKKLLVVILLLALFFRFYNLFNFQFWFSDEEVNAMVVRKVVVENKPVLISPNSTTGLTLGPYYHLLSVPIFYISNLNLQTTLAAMGLLGVITTYVIYAFARSVQDTKFALISAFLYSSSFVMGLFDRRWWPLSICPIVAVISMYSIYQISVNKKYLWSVPLVASLSFGFHADPTIGILTLSSIVAFVLLKIPVLKKEYLLGLLTFLIFLAPLVVFEIKHPGSVTNPIFASLGKNTAPETEKLADIVVDIATKTSMMITNSAFPKPSNFAETYVASGFTGFNSYITTISLPLILISFILPILKRKSLKGNEKQLITILYSFLLSFLAGLFLYSVFYKKPIMQHYYTIVLPILFLLAAFSLSKFVKNQKLLAVFLGIYLVVNLTTMLASKFKYPLSDKLTLTEEISNNLGDEHFSLYQLGDSYSIGGGFPMLFTLENKHIKKSNVYEFYDWMYQAHGLFTTTLVDTEPEKVILLSGAPLANYPENKILSKHHVGNLYGLILDNQDGWFKR